MFITIIYMKKNKAPGAQTGKRETKVLRSGPDRRLAKRGIGQNVPEIE